MKNKNYDFWLKNSPSEIVDIISKFSDEQIKENFNEDLDFGTAGIRSKMGYGNSKINEFIIAQNSYAFGKSLLQMYEDTKKHGVIIFHDNRKNGKEFTKIAAQVLSALEIPVFIPKNNELNPTPFLSYLIMNYEFVGGMNITASHNPKEYNGFKVYDKTGKQANDELVSILKQNVPKDIFSIPMSNSNIHELDEKYSEKYIDAIFKNVPLVENKNRKDLKVIFGTNHGTALNFGLKILNKLQVDYKIVEEQSYPSETFENVLYPNPQDVRSFDVSKEYGDKYNADVLFLTDPDADRFGAMVKHNAKWVYLTGNELPILQIDYKLKMLKKNNEDYNFSNKFIIRSIVTSKLADKIANEYNVKVYEALTGFRSIFEKVELISKQKNEEILFAWEESNGSAVEPIVKDKDSFQAMYQITEMIYEYKLQGKTLVDVMEEIYNKHGYYLMNQITKKFDSLDGLSEMNNFIDEYRNKIKVNDDFFGKKVTKIVDLLTDETEYKKQNVIFYYLENDSWICLRPSGTEPILRIYFEIVGSKEETHQFYSNFIKEVDQI